MLIIITKGLTKVKKVKLKTLVLAIAMSMGGSTFAGLVNINKADSDALAQNLKGVGVKKAEAIVDYRKKHGSFVKIEDLVNVKGIGEGILEKNVEDISLSEGVVTVVESEKTVMKKPVVISKIIPSKGAVKKKPVDEKNVMAKADKKVFKKTVIEVPPKSIGSPKSVE